MKNILKIAAIAALSLFALSCDKEKKEDVVDEGTFTTPVMKDYAKKVEISESACPVKSIELTESGYYVIKEIVTRATKEEYYFGKYTVSGNTYTLSGYGTVTLEGSGSSLKFTVNKSSGENYTGTGSSKTGSTSSIGDKLFRTWTISKTRVSISDGVKANADFNGCNLGEIANFIANQGISISDKESLQGVSVTSVTLTSAGSYILAYSNNRTDVGTCNYSSLSSGSFTYSWDSSTMGYSFENGKGSVAFENGMCLLTLNADIKNSSKTYKTSVVFVMKPA